MITFVSQAKYEWLISQKKINENLFYFIDNSLNDLDNKSKTKKVKVC